MLRRQGRRCATWALRHRLTSFARTLSLRLAVGGGQRELRRGGYQRSGIGAIRAQPLQGRALPVSRASGPGFERGEGETA